MSRKSEKQSRKNNFLFFQEILGGGGVKYEHRRKML